MSSPTLFYQFRIKLFPLSPPTFSPLSLYVSGRLYLCFDPQLLAQVIVERTIYKTNAHSEHLDSRFHFSGILFSTSSLAFELLKILKVYTCPSWFVSTWGFLGPDNSLPSANAVTCFHPHTFSERPPCARGLAIRERTF